MSNRSSVLYSDLHSDLRPYVDDFQRSHAPGAIPTYVDCSPQQAAAVAMLNSFLKKFEDDSNSDADNKAIDLFLSINESMRGKGQPEAETLRDELLLGEFRAAVNRLFDVEFLDSLTLSSIFREGGVGPGASIGAYGDDFYTKLFSGPVTCTSEEIARIYVRGLKDNPQMHAAELVRRAHFGDPLVVSGSKISTVPKNIDISRTICTEPTLNMFFQLGLGQLLAQRLFRVTGIHLSHQQERNRMLAWSGSLTGEFCTIDLKSASDTIGVALLDWCLPPELNALLHMFRCSRTQVRGQDVTLEMISTMGNGFTFPLQTCLFYCVIDAVYHMYSLKRVKPSGDSHGNFGVFGDDMICETKMFGPVCRLLHLLGFKVNETKSFSNGRFRESCGEDYFDGLNIRGFYLKTLETPQARSVAINRLIEWETTHGIRLSRVIQRLLSWTHIMPVPTWSGYDSGVRVPFIIATKLKGVSYSSGSLVHSSWEARAPRLRFVERFTPFSAMGWYCDVDVPSDKYKPRIFNYPGAKLSFLRGDIREYKMAVRRKGVATVYEVKRRITPDWEWSDRDSPHRDNRWRQRWNSAVRYYLDR